jgi:hypothetical protein
MLSCITGSADKFDIHDYPKDVVPPTDNHTVTFVPELNAIVIIANDRSPTRPHSCSDRQHDHLHPAHRHSNHDKKIIPGSPGLIWGHETAFMDRVLLATTAQTEADFDETKHSVIKYGKRQTVTVGEDDSGELQVGIQMGS